MIANLVSAGNMFKQVAVCAAVLFVIVSADDDKAVRKSVVDCINKDIVAVNTVSDRKIQSRFGTLSFLSSCDD